MNDFEHLPKAPITEAIFDFRAAARADLDRDVFDEVAAELAAVYPVREEARRFEGTIQITEGGVVSQDTRVIPHYGIHVRTADRAQVAQFRTDGFTFNRLQPYSSWGELFPEAINLWELYVKLFVPKEVTRLAIRYINRIGLPLPVEDFADWLDAPPVVPEGLPQGISKFLTRVTLHDPESGNSAHVSQVMVPGVDRDKTFILLDIDAFKDVSFDPGAEGVTETFSSLRVLKNRIFFGSLTDRALELLR